MQPGLPDFYWHKISKWANIPKMTTKYTKWPYVNGSKIDQMVIKFANIFKTRHSKIYPNWDLWFENKPSGNPACNKSPRVHR
jgi:hypothetical protein